MENLTSLEAIIENIFTDEKIDWALLKELLKLLSSRLNTSPNDIINVQEPPRENEETHVNYLTELISKCEKRLTKLAKIPRTKIVIHNEGPKLETLSEKVDCLSLKHSHFQSQIDELSKICEGLKSERRNQQKPFQDAIDDFNSQSVYADICKLKKMFYTIQNQMDEMIVKHSAMDASIIRIQEEVDKVSHIPELVDKVNKLFDWKNSLQEEFDVMTERYEHIKTICVSKREVQNLIENKVDYIHLKKYVPLKVFSTTKEEFSEEIKEMRDLFSELHLLFTAKLVDLHKDVQELFNKLASKRRLENRSLQ